MSDELPGVAPAVVPVENSSANAAFAAMRTENSTLKAQIDAIQAKLTEAERKDMDEKTRLSAELDDARRTVAELPAMREATMKLVGQIEAACANELNSIPADKRASIEAVVNQIGIEGRLVAIQSMKSVLGSGTISAGTMTQPGANPNAGLPGSQGAAKPLTVDELRKLPWLSTIKTNDAIGQLSNQDTLRRLEALEAR